MSKVVELNDSNFESEVLQNAAPVLVDFTATWCGPCKKLEPTIVELAGEFEGRVKVAKLDVDGARETAARYGVMSVPTLILFHGGAVKDQVLGLVSKRALTDRIEKVL